MKNNERIKELKNEGMKEFRIPRSGYVINRKSLFLK